PFQAALQFASQTFRVLQQRTHIGPHGPFERLATDALVRADGLAGMAILVRAQATAIDVAAFGPMLPWSPTTVRRIATMAYPHPAEQKLGAFILFPLSAPF